MNKQLEPTWPPDFPPPYPSAVEGHDSLEKPAPEDPNSIGSRRPKRNEPQLTDEEMAKAMPMPLPIVSLGR